ncbi:efflux RND transporter permease subunit [Fimbriimonas ginsengisoli]|uniref:RND multidrug efflux transporter n=1 Tax=Fimbriimonas ginsengisoli Gsoil 348 TaxID=661478 RepID=A0A068NRC1_FIMGI|nr:efflux RND transporter permease subunit [Fimbriimonas ginsengisoli]AIE84139.1 RND multidrug efflux transporter [Fimbriimonas ginsengisoli Gsoil 348]
MRIAEFSVKRPVAVVMRIAALVLLGAICFTRLPIDLLPKITIPTVNVSTSWPNVAPQEMETQITRPIEQSVSSATNIYNVSSSTTMGSSNVRIQFNWGTDIGQAAVEVLQLIQRARRSFPNDPTLQDPTVTKFDPNALPIMVYAISGQSDPIKLRTTVDNEIGPMVETANGVAAATVSGGQQRSIIVDVDPKKLEAYGVTMATVAQRIVQENINSPAGIAKQGETEFTIRSVGYFTSLTEMANVPLGVYNGSLVTLGMVAQIRDSHQETRSYTRLNGKPAVGLTITKQSEANTIEAANNVRAKIAQAEKAYPDLKFTLSYDQSGFIANSIDDLKQTAILGGTLAVIILLFFLRSVRSTLVVALSIPISVVSTFSLLYFCGFTLNTISLSGLALATGLIVDDAVVVLENIFRHIERHKRRAAEAAVTGTTEILSAVVASTLTVIVVFLPLLLIKGQSGQTFGQLALVVIFSISVSLLDATTVVPMLASRLIKEEEVEEEAHPELRAQRGKKVGLLTRAFDWFGRKFEAVDQAYHDRLAWALKHRWWVLGAAFGVTAASWLLVPFIGTETLPATDSGDFSVNVRLPIGTALTVTDQKMKEVEKRLMAVPEVQTVFSGAGTNVSFRGAGGREVGYQGGATVRLKANRKRSTTDVIRQVQRDLGSIPGIRANVTAYDLVTQILSGGATNIEIDVFGEDADVLTRNAAAALEAVRAVPGMENADLGVQDATPELQWKVDRQKAQQLGVSFRDIANAIGTATSGQLSSYYQEKGFQYPIYVQVPEGSRKTVSDLLNLPITPSSGGPDAKPIRLSQVATAVQGMGPNELTRIDRRRYVAINARIQDRSESEVTADVQKVMDNLKLDRGITWSFGVNQKRKAEEFAGLGMSIFLAVALIYMLLATQFESFIYPLIVLTSVPLCALGVVLALFLSGKAFGLTAFIGLLMLIGIVVKNGILLVDYTTQLRGRGLPRDEAILTASPTRLRPILMTTSAAILGMLPLALGIGSGSEMQAPLATAVVGGLLTSTFLTLFVVPIVYTVFDDLARRFRKDPRDLAPSSVIEPSIGAFEHVAGSDDPPSPRPEEVDRIG